MVGYGLSETTATVSCYPTVGYEIGSVGTTLPDVQVKIGDNNEILVKGPTVMSGYYGRPEENEKAFTPDGWFRTGDAGLFDGEGAPILTERLKDLFKTSNGKYIAPQAIESRLGEDRYHRAGSRNRRPAQIRHRHHHPRLRRPQRVRPHQAHTLQFHRRPGGKQRDTPLHCRAHRTSSRKRLAGFEKIKRFTLLPREFTIENGELTNTLKIKRPAISALYADQIEAMYC